MPGRVLSAHEAYSLLDEVREALETVANQHVQQMSAYEWLWYLRRLPAGLMHTQHRTSEAHDRLVAESLIDRSEKTLAVNVSDGGHESLVVDDDVVRAVLELCGLTAATVETHISMRRAAKGSDFITRASDLPAYIPNDERDQARTRYDDRLVNLSPSRTAGFELLHSDTPRRGNGLLLSMGQTAEWGELIGWKGPALDPPHRWLQIGRFVPVLLTLRELSGLAALAGRTEPWCSSELHPLVLLLQALALDIVFDGRYPMAGITLPIAGTVMLRHDDLRDSLRRARLELTDFIEEFFPWSVDVAEVEVTRLLENLPITSWPVTGGRVLYDVGSWVAVDVVAAMNHFDFALRCPEPCTGELANVWAKVFENNTQAVIDRSPWRPSDRLRTLLGRTLRLGGGALTDIDALGQYKDFVLLIDCKAKSFRHEVDAGQHGPIRNIADSLEEAAQSWQEKMKVLAKTPLGDNYDLSGRALIGAVATPFPFYVTEGLATVELAWSTHGPLTAVTSLDEMERFLGGQHPRLASSSQGQSAGAG